jgi:hypothetical protein
LLNLSWLLFYISFGANQHLRKFFITIPPRGIEPLKGKSHHIDNKALNESTNPNLCASLCKPLQKDTKDTPVKPAENPAIDPELEAIITAWPELPEHIKTEIKILLAGYINNGKIQVNP